MDDIARESAPAFVRARRRHPAVESAINNLEKRGLDRVRTRGAVGFERKVCLSILAANLHRIGLLLQRGIAGVSRDCENGGSKPPKLGVPLQAF